MVKREKNLALIRKLFGDTHIKNISLFKANWGRAIIEYHEAGNSRREREISRFIANHCHWGRVIGEKFKWVIVANESIFMIIELDSLQLFLKSCGPLLTWGRFCRSKKFDGSYFALYRKLFQEILIERIFFNKISVTDIEGSWFFHS